MKPRTRKSIAWLITSAVCVLCFAGSASAELVYLWKTNQCPVLPDKGAAKSFIPGVMQAAVVGTPVPTSVGGVFCDLVGSTKSTTFPTVKVKDVYNADIIANPGDPNNPNPGWVWDCILCNYTEYVRYQTPALSLLGTALLLGGLLTAAFYELRRRRARSMAAA